MAAKPTEEKRLRDCLADLDAMEGQLCRLGGNEQRQHSEHQRKIRVLLQAEKVLAEARSFVVSQMLVIEQHRNRDRARAAEAEAYAAEQKALADKHRAEVAERIEKAEERRLAT
jgi:hypothetical protein